MIPEEEIKNAIAANYFQKFDCTKILGKIDFAVKIKRPKNAVDFNDEYLLWAEAKQKPANIPAMLAQLVLTIGKARTFDKILPPSFLGCYDSEKIAFVPYSEIQDIFYQNDFNWNVAPSNHDTKEFRQVHGQIKKIVENNLQQTYLFYFERDDSELRRFINNNFIAGKTGTTAIKIDKNNFLHVYNKWCATVKPTIQVNDWSAAKKHGIIDGDFYLADLLSDENKTLKEKLFVLLRTNHYELDRKINETGMESLLTTGFSDNQKAHALFWAKYDRPPHEDYWDFMVERRDLLVPQDVRERKGSFFTPQIWVELSQRYLADLLGDDWQDEYYVWDCAAGTGNLLAGLTNKYHIWASTLDKQDVDVMRDRIKNGANLLEEHVFQFDFLNDDFSKLPESLQKIINHPQLRKRLIIYINPPYAETAKKETQNKNRINKRGVSFTKTRVEYADKIGIATKELSAQFSTRIYDKCHTAMLAQFSKLKVVQGPNFLKFRNFFKVDFQKGFVVPANTFDNVTGDFPIGFMIWKLDGKKEIDKIKLDIFDETANHIGNKTFYAYDENIFITDWFRKYHTRTEGRNNIGAIGLYGSDFQHNNFIRITNCENHPNRWTYITANNLIEACIYFTVRKVIPADWLNDRDQFLFPNKKWETDFEFQNNCLAYTLFNTNVSAKEGVNHWIPFTESEVGAPTGFDSHFMASFLSGKIIRNAYADLFEQLETEEKNAKTGWKKGKKCEFSKEAQAVLAAGRELWKYYHSQKNSNINAALYDIKEHFQGRNGTGKMNPRSTNEKYNELIGNLREALRILTAKITPKVYEYEFLKK
ncbi:MAG: hypothetical protein LBF08_07435 [Dysgonamonadaceae bacterium]|jgi:hypothetical protein|nr:hypothetical protein [Dysgonamonadaceae bacterium]